MQNAPTPRHLSRGWVDKPLPIRRVACFGLASVFGTLALIHSAAHAASPSAISRVCEAKVPGSGGETKSPIIVNRLKTDGPMVRLEGVVESSDPQKSGGLRGARTVEVTVPEALDLCRQGFPVDVLDLSRVPRATDGGQKTVVQPVANLPSDFTITRIWNLWQGWATYGNFWVPAALPSGHTYQVVDFTVTPSTNYQNSGSKSHLAVSVLTVSDSNLNSDFDGKGLTLFATARCALAWQRAALQSWAIQGFSEPPGACSNPAVCSNPVFDGSNGNPSSCGPWDAASTQRFLVGANIWQDSVSGCVTRGVARHGPHPRSIVLRRTFVRAEPAWPFCTPAPKTSSGRFPSRM